MIKKGQCIMLKNLVEVKRNVIEGEMFGGHNFRRCYFFQSAMNLKKKLPHLRICLSIDA